MSSVYCFRFMQLGLVHRSTNDHRYHITHAVKTYAKCFVHNTIQIIIRQGLREKTLTNNTDKR